MEERGSNLLALGGFMGKDLDSFEKTDPKILQATADYEIKKNDKTQIQN